MLSKSVGHFSRILRLNTRLQSACCADAIRFIDKLTYSGTVPPSTLSRDSTPTDLADTCWQPTSSTQSNLLHIIDYLQTNLTHYPHHTPLQDPPPAPTPSKLIQSIISNNIPPQCQTGRINFKHHIKIKPHLYVPLTTYNVFSTRWGPKGGGTTTQMKSFYLYGNHI